MRNRLRGVSEPEFDVDRLLWTAPGIALEITPRVRGPEVTLHEGIRWNCCIPAGDAVVRLSGGTLRGTGYAEVLEMTVPPWSVPIRELRWGRAIGTRTSLVWIGWAGENPLRVGVRDGTIEKPSSVDDDEVRFEDNTLVRLHGRVPLRRQRLASTLRPLARFFPAMFRAAREEKWRSRFETQDDEGWAVHERITFAAD